MNKKLAIILIVAAFIVGIIGGGGSVGYYFIRHLIGINRVIEQSEIQDQTGNAILCISALKKLRADGTTNVAEFLESRLDDSTAALGRYVENIPNSQRDPDSVEIKVLRRTKEYRDQFPRKKTDSSIDADVAGAFNLLNDITNR
jgi:hypothetical protein